MDKSKRDNLVALLRSLDESALVALANKGLVRRAMKDLEKELDQIQVEEKDDHLLVRGPDWCVIMPESGPMKASDDTRASGITRQIISATIYLRDRYFADDSAQATDAEAESEADSDAETDIKPEPEPATVSHMQAPVTRLLGVEVNDIVKWTGKNIYREVSDLIDSGTVIEYEILEAPAFTIRFSRDDVEVKLLPTETVGKKLLEELISTAPKSFHKRWVTMALLLLKQGQGENVSLVEDAVEKVVSSPRSREQIVAECKALLTGLVANGVVHPSEMLIEKLFSLSVSASSVGLPRVSNLLKSLSDEVSHMLKRDVAADSERILNLCSYTYVLLLALESAPPEKQPDYAGRARTQYDLKGDMKLIGIGAYPWKSGSGYEGITVLFFAPETKQFYTWSNSRTAGTTRFKAANSYLSDLIWSGGSVFRLSRSGFTLRQARVNSFGRLSVSNKSSVEDAEQYNFESLDFGDRAFDNWTALSGYADRLVSRGLTVVAPQDRYAVLCPEKWGEKFFDEMQQKFCWQILDVQGMSIHLTLDWQSVNEESIKFLEAVNPKKEKLRAVVVRLDTREAGISIEPIAFLRDGEKENDTVLNIAFDFDRIISVQSGLLERLRKKFGRDKIATRMTIAGPRPGDDDLDELALQQTGGAMLPSSLRRLLEDAGVMVTHMAESGVFILSDSQKQKVLALKARLAACGLAALAQSLGAMAFCESADGNNRDDSGRSSVAANLLISSYLLNLHWQVINGGALNEA
ncbi:hypothetical protein GC174_10125 [bacterium]|nr:hypothetical protein [bacterium]